MSNLEIEMKLDNAAFSGEDISPEIAQCLRNLAKARPKQLPICNYKQESFTVKSLYGRANEIEIFPQIDLTTEQYMHISSDCRGTREIDNSHRIRTAIVSFNEDGTTRRFAGHTAKHYAIFLTDSKVHKKPEAVEKLQALPTITIREPNEAQKAYTQKKQELASPDRTAKFEALKEQARTSVQAVAAPQLFVTPESLAERVIDAADIQPGQTVLEPSAGTGALLNAIPHGAQVSAVEFNNNLALSLVNRYPAVNVRCYDFLSCNEELLGKYDRIVMNPPFAKQEDIEHVTHALNFLNDGGKLVAIMSAGVLFRQDKKATDFRALVEEKGGIIEELPDDSFKSSGTMVKTVIVEMCL